MKRLQLPLNAVKISATNKSKWRPIDEIFVCFRCADLCNDFLRYR